MVVFFLGGGGGLEELGVNPTTQINFFFNLTDFFKKNRQITRLPPHPTPLREILMHFKI